MHQKCHSMIFLCELAEGAVVTKGVFSGNSALLNKFNFLFNFFVDFAVTPWLTCVTILVIVLSNFQSYWLILPKSSAGQETLHQGSCSTQGSILCYCPLCQLQTLNFKAVNSTHSPRSNTYTQGKSKQSQWLMASIT